VKKFLIALAVVSTAYLLVPTLSAQTSGKSRASQALQRIEALTDWDVSNGSSTFSGPPYSRSICNAIKTSSAFTISRSDYSWTLAQLNDRRASRAVNRLQRRVSQYLRNSGWRPVSDTCYERHGAVVVIGESSYRGTMTSPSGPDAMIVFVFSPDASDDQVSPHN